MLSVIDLVLSLLRSYLEAAQLKSDTPTAVIDAIQAAIAKLETVQGSPVTYGQLEGLRVTPKW